MREIFASPDIRTTPPSSSSSRRRDRQLLRKWGSWQDWQHDTAVITGPGRHYILVALTHAPAGGLYLEALARGVDDWWQAP